MALSRDLEYEALIHRSTLFFMFLLLTKYLVVCRFFKKY